MATNPELELAYRFISETNRHVFLTGKAGTGKTTFLHRVREEIPKRKVVVAPTGVAAINAKGVTIHSQFQLPFGVVTPDRLEGEMRKHRLSGKKAEVLRSLDLLVIDEISMVRADVLDALGAVLRKYRGNSQPFGGVQLLMIGDLHQLPPVVRDADWNEMRTHYQTPYFFGSRELADAGVRTIQLRHIYRQSDADFIDLLNQVRNDRLDAKSLAHLNSRYKGPDFHPAAGDDYITLTSHNRTAQSINTRQLGTLHSPLHPFKAKISGNFPESMYPNDPELKFRVGAQVMFNKNDTSEHRYFNGKIGRIMAIDGERITVECSDDEEAITVLPVEWGNRKYELDKQSKEVTDEIIGTYAQHPLRLAWAITIHKSQGLTFERVIIDAADAFAHGQVYVALSRCKTFDGIVLRSRIGDGSVRTDRVVSDYSARAEEQAPTAADLREDRRRYQLNCLQELFDFTDTDRRLAHLERSLFEHETAIQGEALTEIREIRKQLEEQVAQLCRSFALQVNQYARAEPLPTEHPELAGRLQKAGDYLVPRLRDVYAELGKLSFMSDNRKVYDTVSDRLKEAGLALLTKLRAFESLTGGFQPEKYVRSRADAALEFEQRSDTPQAGTRPKVASPHPELYARLAKWRTRQAEDSGIPPYRILHNAVLLAVAEILPVSRAEMLGVPGFGPKSYASYGEDLLGLVEEYVTGTGKSLPADASAGSAAPPSRRNTRQITLDSFRAGRSVAEIATERELTEGTIYTHLSHWVARGELAATELIEEEPLKVLLDHLEGHPDQTVAETYAHFAEAYRYEEIRLAGNVRKARAESAD